MGIAVVFAAATVVTMAFGGAGDEKTASAPIGGSPPASGVHPSKLPEAKDDLPPAPAIVRLIIPSLQIDAPVVTLSAGRDGAMDSPRSPFVVAWYDFSAPPGAGSNIVIAGHAAYPDFGAAVFDGLAFVRPGDELQLLLPDYTIARYGVSSAETYDAASAPVDAIIGHTDAEVLTLISTSVSGDPMKRLVVRGDRIVEGALAR